MGRRGSHTSSSFSSATAGPPHSRATASDARLKAALSAAQSILPLKARIDETEFLAKLPDRSAEHRARWERLKREGVADAAKRELKQDVIDGQPVIAGSTSAITGNS